MRFVFIMIFLALFCTCCESNIKREKREDGLIYVYQVKNNVPHGMYQVYDANNLLVQKGTLINGKLEGDFFYYYPSGALMMDMNMVNNTTEGKGYRYYETGEMMEALHVKNGLRDGECKSYYLNLNVNVSANYKEGNLHGKSYTYFENGNLERIDEWEDGKLMDSTIVYNDEISWLFVNTIIGSVYDACQIKKLKYNNKIFVVKELLIEEELLNFKSFFKELNGSKILRGKTNLDKLLESTKNNYGIDLKEDILNRVNEIDYSLINDSQLSDYFDKNEVILKMSYPFISKDKDFVIVMFQLIYFDKKIEGYSRMILTGENYYIMEYTEVIGKSGGVILHKDEK